MKDYQLIIKLMRVTDKRNPQALGLPLKYIITTNNMHIGLFDPTCVSDKNIIGFNIDGDFAWVISNTPDVPKNFKQSWIQMFINENNDLIAVSADEHQYIVDLSNGQIRPSFP
jgi:hypothetical protein